MCLLSFICYSCLKVSYLNNAVEQVKIKVENILDGYYKYLIFRVIGQRVFTTEKNKHIENEIGY